MRYDVNSDDVGQKRELWKHGTWQQV